MTHENTSTLLKDGDWRGSHNNARRDWYPFDFEMDWVRYCEGELYIPNHIFNANVKKVGKKIQKKRNVLGNAKKIHRRWTETVGLFFELSATAHSVFHSSDTMVNCYLNCSVNCLNCIYNSVNACVIQFRNVI